MIRPDSSAMIRKARKLLLHDREIKRLIITVETKGLTLIPLRVYFKGNMPKSRLLSAGETAYDKRAAIAEREINRDLQRHMKHY